MKRWRISVSDGAIPIFIVLACALGVSGFVVIRNTTRMKERIESRAWLTVDDMQMTADIQLDEKAEAAPASANNDSTLFAGELRVAAIGSAYPIPYAADICPFTEIPQPAMNQLDRDGDGITDDWELKYGLDKHSKADASADSDGDGFSNLEEFTAATDPRNPENHPPYVAKLRFVERKEIPFPLVFQGVTELSDGAMAFQLNSPADGMTHFSALGEPVEGVLLQRFIPAENNSVERLIVERNGVEIELVRGEISADPESQAELINILDQSPIIVTMGALLSLRNDEYAVLSVHHNKVVVRQIKSGIVFEIISLADEE